MAQYFNASGSLAKILASTTHWKHSPNSGAAGNNLKTNNSSGFSALPSGYRPGGYTINDTIPFNKIDSVVVWWSSTTQPDSIKKALSISLKNDLSTTERAGYMKQSGFSVRCVKNAN